MMNRVNVDTDYNRESWQQEQPENHDEAPVLVAEIPMRVEYPDRSHLPEDNEQRFIDDAEVSQDLEETSSEISEPAQERHRTTHQLQNQLATP